MPTYLFSQLSNEGNIGLFFNTKAYAFRIIFKKPCKFKYKGSKVA